MDDAGIPLMGVMGAFIFAAQMINRDAHIFTCVDTGETSFVSETLDKDTTTTRMEALIEVYKKLRPGDPPTGDNAEKLVESLFFNFRRYDLGRVGRYKFNKKLGPVADRMGIKVRDFLAPLFVAISGSRASFSVVDAMGLLGPDMTRARIREAIEVLGGVSKKAGKRLEKVYRTLPS